MAVSAAADLGDARNRATDAQSAAVKSTHRALVFIQAGGVVLKAPLRSGNCVGGAWRCARACGGQQRPTYAQTGACCDADVACGAGTALQATVPKTDAQRCLLPRPQRASSATLDANVDGRRLPRCARQARAPVSSAFIASALGARQRCAQMPRAARAGQYHPDAVPCAGAGRCQTAARRLPSSAALCTRCSLPFRSLAPTLTKRVTASGQAAAHS